jgi:hypothetical protein
MHKNEDIIKKKKLGTGDFYRHWYSKSNLNSSRPNADQIKLLRVTLH